MANTIGEANISKFLVADFLDNPITQIYSILIDIIVTVTLILTPFYYYLIIQKSSKNMKNYRTFLLFYTTFTLFITLLFLIAKPTLILPLSISLPNGWISNLPKIPTLLCFILSYIAGSITTDLLLLALIQRYFNVSQVFIHHSQIFKFMSYGFIITTNIANNIFSQIDQLQCLLPDDEIKKFLMARLEKPAEFLSKFPYIAVSFCSTSFSSPTYIFNLSIWITRFALFGIIIYKNLTFAKKYTLKIGAGTAKMHKMLVKAVITQILGCFICTRFPLLLVFAILQTQNMMFITVASYFYLIALCALPLVDMAITVYFVTPYRKFLCKLLLRKKVSDVNVVNMSSSAMTNVI